MSAAGESQAQTDLDRSQMHPGVAGDWPLWSPIVEASVRRRFAALNDRFPELGSAVLATADGMHIASHGVDGDVGDRLAAMNASLFGVARAEAEVVSGGETPGLSAVVSVLVGQHQVVLLSFVLEPFGQLLLSIAAKDVQLGIAIVHARGAAAELHDALGATTAGL